MIRKFTNNDLDSLIQIWLTTNIETHNFIPKEYWTDHYSEVKEMLPLAELYIYENDQTKQIEGFIGLINDYIAGIFVKSKVQSKGIGKQLLDYIKNLRQHLHLSVYQKNQRAIYFYQREQFIIDSENMDNDTGEKEFVMVWKR